MKRRDFSVQLAAFGGLGLASAGPVLAQGGPVEGQQYKRLPKDRQPSLPSPAHKVEVVEFFWYGCGHCFAFEPALQAWEAQLPADIHFRRIPYPMLGPADHQKLYYALEDMGLVPTLHRKIFNAIHVDQKRLNNEADIVAFMATLGVDSAKLSAAFKSFSVINKLTLGRQLAAHFQVDSVPMLGVQGRYTTSPTMAGSGERALAVVNFLAQKSRQGA